MRPLSAVSFLPCAMTDRVGSVTSPSGGVIVGEHRTETPGSAVGVRAPRALRLINSFRGASSSTRQVKHGAPISAGVGRIVQEPGSIDLQPWGVAVVPWTHDLARGRCQSKEVRESHALQAFG